MTMKARILLECPADIEATIKLTMTRFLVTLALLGGVGCTPTQAESPKPIVEMLIRGIPYVCLIRHAAWNTDMIICWPLDGTTNRSEGVMRFWRENPNGTVDMPPCEPTPESRP